MSDGVPVIDYRSRGAGMDLEHAEATIAKIQKMDTGMGRMLLMFDDDTIVGIVMTLTGGTVNPAVIRSQVRNRREAIQ